MWDERYSQPGFVYGTEPNEFLASVAARIPIGPVLSLGEGEGRNAAFLASLGHRVLAVDQSDSMIQRTVCSPLRRDRPAYSRSTASVTTSVPAPTSISWDAAACASDCTSNA